MSPQLLDHYVRAGRFERRRRGLYRIAGFPSDEHDAIRAAWLAVGADKAVVSHESALALQALSDHIPDAVHLLVPRNHRGVRRPTGVVLHTSTRDDPIPTVRRDGIAITAPARSIVDAANDLQPDQLVMAIWQALARGLLTRRQLEEEADRQHRRSITERALAERRRPSSGVSRSPDSESAWPSSSSCADSSPSRPSTHLVGA